MSKKDYIDAINELKVDDKLKRETINKIKSGGKSMKKKPQIYAFAVVMIVILVSALLQLNVNRDEIHNVAINQDMLSLPKVGTFENLYDLLKIEEVSDMSYGIMKEMSMQGMVAEESDIRDTGAVNENSAVDTARGGDYSGTNVQVANVDEGDIVKTDGRYIYYISTQYMMISKVVIIDAMNPEELEIVCEIEFASNEFQPSELYINNNKLIVIGTNNVYSNMLTKDIAVDRAYYPYSQFTTAKVYNVNNKDNVQLEREIEIEGYYLTSRMIGDNIYFLANKNIYTYYGIKGELDEGEFKPQYRDTASSDEVRCIEFPDIYYFPGSEERSYLNIASFNINNNNEANIDSYLGAGNQVYVSEKSIYVTNTKYEYEEIKEQNSTREIMVVDSSHTITTKIYKFSLDNANVNYVGVGEVPGEPLNQFAMDEKDDNFRIATTNSTSWNADSNTNNLYVLNNEMNIIGRLEGLAPGERIYSVRFMGQRAYMVTFVQVDPLFVIDLSNPRNPTVLGELKIPGYSKYLHPYDDNHIIGIGEDTIVQDFEAKEEPETQIIGEGDTAISMTKLPTPIVRTDGMKMALFDVTDPNNPKELYVEKIGDRGTSSEILYNHKSLLFSKEKNIIAFPITITEERNNYTNDLKFSGAIVYGLDLNTGFYLKGMIADQEITNSYRDYDYYKAINRILYIKDTLFTLSYKLVKAVDMKTMELKGEVEIKIDESGYMDIMPFEEDIIEEPLENVKMEGLDKGNMNQSTEPYIGPNGW